MIRSDAVNAMLLNEFPKEHKAVVEEQHKVQKIRSNRCGLSGNGKRAHNTNPQSERRDPNAKGANTKRRQEGVKTVPR
jgi:hypothetical protein